MLSGCFTHVGVWNYDMYGFVGFELKGKVMQSGSWKIMIALVLLIIAAVGTLGLAVEKLGDGANLEQDSSAHRLAIEQGKREQLEMAVENAELEVKAAVRAAQSAHFNALELHALFSLVQGDWRGALGGAIDHPNNVRTFQDAKGRVEMAVLQLKKARIDLENCDQEIALLTSAGSSK